MKNCYSHSMSSFRITKKSLAIAFSVVSLLTFNACGGSSNSDGESSSDQESSVAGDEYPEEVRSAYLESCVSSATDASLTDEEVAMIEDLCGCTLEVIEDEISYAEFVEAEEDILSGNASGIDLEAIAASCVE
jgi:hypothetical protein